VNPIDTKIRRGSPVAGGAVRIPGFDAAGTVEAIAPDVTRFGVGDDVDYAGVTNRPESNAEFKIVDEHIVGRNHATLDFTQSAALPLTTITAWEGLFDHLGLTPDSSGTLAAVAAAGGVGSMVTQLARAHRSLSRHAIARGLSSVPSPTSRAPMSCLGALFTRSSRLALLLVVRSGRLAVDAEILATGAIAIARGPMARTLAFRSCQ
jgi:hypothetical protein